MGQTVEIEITKIFTGSFRGINDLGEGLANHITLDTRIDYKMDLRDLKGNIIDINKGLSSSSDYGAAQALIRKYVHLFERGPHDLHQSDMPYT